MYTLEPRRLAVPALAALSLLAAALTLAAKVPVPTSGDTARVQTEGVLFTLVYTLILTYIILKPVDLVIGLRVTEEQETEGLDLSQHGERVHI